MKLLLSGRPTAPVITLVELEHPASAAAGADVSGPPCLRVLSRHRNAARTLLQEIRRGKKTRD